MIISQKER